MDIRSEGTLVMLEAMCTGDTSGAIERSEARGQAALVASAQLPADMGRGEYSCRPALEAMGVRIIGPTVGDPMFVDVALPEGWRKVRTDHSMWSNLVDANGYARASIFYKAAFYDRAAHMSVRCRFTMRHRYFEKYTRSIAYVLDQREEAKDEAGTRVVWASEPAVYKTDRLAFDDNAEGKSIAKATEWLAANLPDWKDPLAYWTDEPRPTVCAFPSWRAE